ncbi:hypothetical protein BGZ70_002819 [Mortierella alpina]|uniref:Protein kinase domain-containing protein n=1 Tax=Mortierella alpina TaxID=64518 RepID=A0A9P6JBJ2_MORAP|nr:hypothetical protein BGZ70_002819 [Mortierella alpina]
MTSSIVLIEKISNGSQSEVFKAKRRLDIIAVKKFRHGQNEASKREIELLKQVRARHIIQFYGVEQDRVMMEYAEGGSLAQAISHGTLRNWEIKNLIAKEVSLGLVYLHMLGIVHCNINSTNVLLTKHQQAKICDFGRARAFGETGERGDLAWMAPELFRDPPQYSDKSDVYALGMVMWEMAAACTQPYQGQSIDVVTKSITNGITEKVPKGTPDEYARCIQQCWRQAPEERPDAEFILPGILPGHNADADDQAHIIFSDKHPATYELIDTRGAGASKEYYKAKALREVGAAHRELN